MEWLFPRQHNNNHTSYSEVCHSVAMAMTPLAIKYIGKLYPASLPKHSHRQFWSFAVCNPTLLCIAYCNQRLDVGTAWEWEECSWSSQLTVLHVQAVCMWPGPCTDLCMSTGGGVKTNQSSSCDLDWIIIFISDEPEKHQTCLQVSMYTPSCVQLHLLTNLFISHQLDSLQLTQWS